MTYETWWNRFWGVVALVGVMLAFLEDSFLGGAASVTATWACVAVGLITLRRSCQLSIESRRQGAEPSMQRSTLLGSGVIVVIAITRVSAFLALLTVLIAVVSSPDVIEHVRRPSKNSASSSATDSDGGGDDLPG